MEDLSDELTLRSKAFFGTTKNKKEAGYITKDADLLDFSGKKFGAMGGDRSMDHRELPEDVLNLMGKQSGGSEGMIEFLNKSKSIRYSPESTGFELTRKPSNQQIAKMVELSGGENALIDVADNAGNVFASIDMEKPSLQKIKKFLQEKAPGLKSLGYALPLVGAGLATFESAQAGTTEPLQREIIDSASMGILGPEQVGGDKDIDMFEKGQISKKELMERKKAFRGF